MVVIQHGYIETIETVELVSKADRDLTDLLMRLLDSNTITERGADYFWATRPESRTL